MKTLVVIPTYNERESIIPLIKILKQTNELDILVVDDGSPDGTGALVDAFAAERSDIFCLHRERKMGLGTAYREGFAWALKHSYEQIVQMDGDGSHDPSHLPALRGEGEKWGLVIGSRYVPGGGSSVNWGLHRKLMSSLGNWYANTILHFRDRRYRIQDSTGGYKCWNADVLRQIDFSKIISDGYAFQIEMNWLAVQQGARIREIPIFFKDRTGGKSKLARSGILRTALVPLLLRKK